MGSILKYDEDTIHEVNDNEIDQRAENLKMMNNFHETSRSNENSLRKLSYKSLR